MMSKTRSGIAAKIKATLVIPFALVAFLLFADFSLAGPGESIFDNEASRSGEISKTSFTGLWVKQNKDNFSKMICFTDEKFSYYEGDEIIEYFWKLEKGNLIISQVNGVGGIPLKVENQGEELTIWWNDLHSSRYIKSPADNSMDHLLSEQNLKIELPYLSQYRLMEKQSLLFRVSLGYAKDGSSSLAFNGKVIELSELPALVEKERSKHSKLEVNSLTAMFFIDTKMPMKEVSKVREELRKINALHIADAGYPHGDITISPLLYHTVALPRLLPPQDALILDKETIEKKGGDLFVIDLSARNTTPRDVDNNLQQFIGENEDGKYVLSLEYDNEIPYGQYIETVDMIFNVVYKFRNELAMEKYKAPYAQLGDALQKEIRKAYPIALSEAWNEN